MTVSPSQPAGREYVFDTTHDRYPVAVHVILTRPTDGRVLLMRRAGSGYADGQLGLPAGHVDLGETPTASAVREIDDPDHLPADALDFIGQAITNARTGRHFHEYGWEPVKAT